MDSATLLNFLLVLFFVLLGGVFAGTEMALVSLRESQVRQMERSGKRGARIAARSAGGKYEDYISHVA